MKIDYKILWIEDHPDRVESTIKSLRDSLSDLGFSLEVEERISFSQDEINDLVKKLKIYNPYDLVVFDYDLGSGSKNGAEIAKGLRQRIYTDMIFYSSKAVKDMREDLYKKKVDGVYVVTRTELAEDAAEIIRDQVKKICDLNNMRGLVLDEISKLDIRLRQLLVDHFTTITNDKKEQQINRFKKTLKKRSDALIKDYDEIDIKSFTTTFLNPLKTDFNSVLCRLQSMRVLSTFSPDVRGKIEKLQKLRNEFAHKDATLNIENGRIILNNSKGFPDGFDHAAFAKIRKDLRDVVCEVDSLCIKND